LQGIALRPHGAIVIEPLIESTHRDRFRRRVQGASPNDRDFVGVQETRVDGDWVVTRKVRLYSWLAALDWIGSIGVLDVSGSSADLPDRSQ
jgi:hypothetical protein